MAALCLLLMPFVQIGWSIDFAMRASIPALAVITVQIADALTGNTASRRRKIAFMALLGIGSVTPLSEIARGLTFGSSPPPRCDVINAWNLSFSNFPLGTYLAPLDDVPAAIRPRHPAIAQHHQTTDCFARAWAVPPLFKSGAAAQPETAADTLTKPAR
jgi:hypothetical protein